LKDFNGISTVRTWMKFVNVFKIRLAKMKNCLFRHIFFTAHSFAVTTKNFESKVLGNRVGKLRAL